MICLFGLNARYGGICLVSRAMADLGFDVRTVLVQRRFPDLEALASSVISADSLWAQDVMRASDHIMVFGCDSLRSLNKLMARYGRTELSSWDTNAVIVTDSLYAREYRKLNQFFRDNGTDLYVMPDLFPYLEKLTAVPYYPYLGELRKCSKPARLTVAHSPGRKLRSDLKGTSRIVRAMKGMDADLTIIHGQDWESCLRLKSQSHIFIDQIINNKAKPIRTHIRKNYKGGIGKSGLEAMLLGSMLITSGDQPTTSPFFPPPPAVWVTPDNFPDILHRYITDAELRDERIRQQREWARCYLSKKFVVNSITRHITGYGEEN